MRCLLLSARPELRVNQRLRQAAEQLGVELRLVDATRVVAATGPRPGLWLGGEELLDPPPDMVLARVGNWRPEALLAQLEVAQARGLWTPNPAVAMRLARDHWQTLQRLHEHGFVVPETLVGADPEELAGAAGRLGFPLVVKLRRSRMGVGVIRCDGQDHLDSVLDSLWRLGDEMLVQRWVACDSTSLRLLVVAGQVVAAARFRAVVGEWRSNGARGGVAEAYHPQSDESRLAVAAAAAVGLGLCGVDLLPTLTGAVLCELNPTPGFRHLEQATGEDVAAAVMARVLRAARGSATGA